jgi:hypothetical protein
VTKIDNALQAPPAKKNPDPAPKKEVKQSPKPQQPTAAPAGTQPKKAEPSIMDFQIHQRAQAGITGKKPGLIESAMVSIIGSSYVSEKTKISYARISNPDLAVEDRDLIEAYLAYKAIGYDSKAEKTRQDIINRFIDRNLSLMRNYDGKLSLGNSVQIKRIDALDFIIQDMNLMTPKEARTAAWVMNAQSLDPNDLKLLKDFERTKKAISSADNVLEASGIAQGADNLEQQILERALSYNELQGSLLYDDKDRGKLLRNVLAFNAMASFLGVPIEQVSGDISMTFPEYGELMMLNQAAQTPEKIDDEKLAPLAFGRCKKMYREYLTAISSGSADPGYISAMQNRASVYFEVASGLGVDKKQLDSAVASINAEFKNKIKFSNLSFEEMQKGGQAYIIKPDMLPDKIKGHLSSIQKEPGMNYFQWIKKNVEFIVVSPTLVYDPAKIGDGGAGGWVDGYLPIVNLDIFDENSGKLRTSAETASILVHETDHVEYMHRYIGNKLARQSAFTEGHAYFEGYQFASRLYEKMFSSDPKADEAVRLKNDIEFSRSTYESALKMMGGTLFGGKFDVERLLKRANPDLDYSIYPTQTIYAQSKMMTNIISSAAGLTPEEQKALEPMLTKMISRGTDKIERAPENERLIKKIIGSLYPKYASKSLEEAVRLIKRDNFAAETVRDMNKQLLVLLSSKIEDLSSSGKKLTNDDIQAYYSLRWARNGGLAGFRTKQDQIKVLKQLLAWSVSYGVLDKKSAKEIMDSANRPDAEMFAQVKQGRTELTSSDLDLYFMSILQGKAMK